MGNNNSCQERISQRELLRELQLKRKLSSDSDQQMQQNRKFSLLVMKVLNSIYVPKYYFKEEDMTKKLQYQKKNNNRILLIPKLDSIKESFIYQRRRKMISMLENMEMNTQCS
ncbi:hypothetical protein PPERSA_03421 [Pseudocohnilembus persalinus]|uniref:Uncharacterized protein n=1 Tax=Pseudocohnilembus persalinus TaxID=266149 RepID=A0A0V0QC46_PSEPJ|nr:hypothetical protein PPERSA_03421 [Pseudocohnilembus persalinus]|eukprot:KRW99620.1 hypothetical protein PPERSA_03421 [Pseudocohnilembus persalinus]